MKHDITCPTTIEGQWKHYKPTTIEGQWKHYRRKEIGCNQPTRCYLHHGLEGVVNAAQGVGKFDTTTSKMQFEA